MKMPDVKPNVIDRVVSYFNPLAGAARMRSRAMMAFAGSFTGASRDRRSMSQWTTTRYDADGDLSQDLDILRQRSRDLSRNDPMGGGAVSTVVTNVVGTGLILQSEPDIKALKWTDEKAEEWSEHVEREFSLWADSKDCDIARTLNLYGLQELAFRSTLENGDCFVILPMVRRATCPYDLRIQLVEGDRVCNKSNAADSMRVTGGVVKSETTGEPIAYQIMKDHPGNITGRAKQEWIELPAYGPKTGRVNVIHLFKPVRIGQTRGIPFLAPVIESLKQLGRYTESELMAAVISGMFTVFITSQGAGDVGPMVPTAETGGAAGDDDLKLAAGAIAHLAPGESISTANPGRPNDKFDPFVTAILRQVGVALEIPYEILVKHFTSSYTAARAAFLEAWRFFSARRHWLSQNFCQVVYEVWMAEAVATGRVKAPGFFENPAMRKAYLKAAWHGPAKGMIQENEEVKAAQARVDMGITTLAEETAQLTGGDWATKHRQRAKEAKARLEAGLEEPKMKQIAGPIGADGAPVRPKNEPFLDPGQVKNKPEPGSEDDEEGGNS